MLKGGKITGLMFNRAREPASVPAAAPPGAEDERKKRTWPRARVQRNFAWASAALLVFLFMCAVFSRMLELSTCCAPWRPWRCVDGTEVPSLRISAMQPLRIGFITYATGPYNDFVHALWRSIEQHAFRDHEVHLFVFTDRANETALLGDRVHARQQARVGWPFDSVGRHFLYRDAAAWYAEMDYMLSVDADSILTSALDTTVLGERIATVQAWFYAHPTSYWTNDRRLTVAGTRYSAAYIADSEACCYFTGSLFGGSRLSFTALMRETTRLALIDFGANPPRVARWHDESYLNRVFINLPPTVVLRPHFMYPEPPSDAWLVDPLSGAAHAWLSANPWLIDPLFGVAHASGTLLYPASKRKFLNLGVRKHASKSLAEFQPPSSVIPAFMNPMGREGNVLPIFPVPERVRDLVTLVMQPALTSSGLKRRVFSAAFAPPDAARVLWAENSQSVASVGIETPFALLVRVDKDDEFRGFDWTDVSWWHFAYEIGHAILVLESRFCVAELCSSALPGFPRCAVDYLQPLPFMTTHISCGPADADARLRNAPMLIFNVSAMGSSAIADIAADAGKAETAVCVLSPNAWGGFYSPYF